MAHVLNALSSEHNDAKKEAWKQAHLESRLTADERRTESGYVGAVEATLREDSLAQSHGEEELAALHKSAKGVLTEPRTPRGAPGGVVARLRKELGSASAEEEADLHAADADLNAAKREDRVL